MTVAPKPPFGKDAAKGTKEPKVSNAAAYTNRQFVIFADIQ